MRGKIPFETDKKIESELPNNSKPTKLIYTLADSASEEGEIKKDTYPFHKSYFANNLYRYHPVSNEYVTYDKYVLIGDNKMPNPKNFTFLDFSSNRFKKEFKKCYPHIKNGENILEESRMFFVNNKLLQLEEPNKKYSINILNKKDVLGVPGIVDSDLLNNNSNNINLNSDQNINNNDNLNNDKNANNKPSIDIKLINKYQTEMKYNEFIESIFNQNNDIFAKKVNIVRYKENKCIVLRDKMINTFAKITSSYIYGATRNNTLIFNKTFFNGVQLNDFNFYLLEDTENSSVRKRDKINEKNEEDSFREDGNIVGGLLLNEKEHIPITYEVKEYSIQLSDKKESFLLYIHSCPEYEFGNAIDTKQSKLKVIKYNPAKYKNSVVDIKHGFGGLETNIWHLLLQNEIIDGKKYCLHDKNLYEVGTAGEQLDYKDMDYSKFEYF